MELFTFVLVAVAAAVVIAFVAHYLTLVVRDDGYRVRNAGRAPRSHHNDPFEPRSRVA